MTPMFVMAIILASIVGVLTRAVILLKRENEKLEAIVEAQKTVIDLVKGQNDKIRTRHTSALEFANDLTHAITDSFKVTDYRTFLKTRATRAFEKYNECTQD